jgi:tetratricopeptide (TPR) repeat protein
MKNITLLIFCFCALLGSCTHPIDARLERVNQLADAMSPEAIASLDSINREDLSASDRHYYDLLYVKSRDKNYVCHTSDSLILDVIDYYARHQDTGLYPEALYYGGRVYSDLGDLPTALTYFQSALDVIPEDKEYVRLHAIILSQTGRLLNNLRLYSEAVHYLEQAIPYDSLTHNIYAQAYDYQLLGAIKKHQKVYDEATAYIQRALQLSASLSEADSVSIALSLADIQQCQEHYDSVVTLIQGLPEKTDSLTWGYALTIASGAYYDVGSWDTAYYYAKELIHVPEFTYRKNGYEILLQPELRAYIPLDTLIDYCLQFHKELVNYLDQHEAQAALMQNSMYNYRKHKRERDAAQVSERQIAGALIGALILVLVLFIVLLYMKNRNAQQIIRLRQALDMVTNAHEVNCQRGEGFNDAAEYEPTMLTTESLKKQILQKLHDKQYSYHVPLTILQSHAYKQLHNCLDTGTGITDKDPLWRELEDTVNGCFPGFKSRLLLLTDNRMSDTDLQIVLLIKCGISPIEMSKLLHKTISTITSRRSYLAYKIFGEKNMGAKIVDSVIWQI